MYSTQSLRGSPRILSPSFRQQYPPTSTPFISFLLSLSHSPLPPNLPGITSQITYWHRTPSLRARLGGPTLKTGMQISLETEDKKRYYPLRLEIFLAKYYEGKSWREEGSVGVTISGAGRRQCKPEGLPSGVNGRPG